MYRHLFTLVLLFVALNITVTAEQNTNSKPAFRLLYYVDDINDRGYLVPFIEAYLKDLSYPGRNPVPVYPEVISLNMLYEKRKVEGKLIDAFIYANRHETILNNSKERNSLDAEISKSLLNYDRFLVIKINPFNTLFEYQFLMYDVIKNKTTGVQDMPVLKDYKSASAIINPMSASCKEDLAFTIKQVCPEVNEPPVAQIKVNSRIPQSVLDTIYVRVGDTLNISAIAIDSDSPKERFTYTWTVSDEMLYGQIAFGKANQQIIIDTPSVFTIGLIVGDGISQSKKTNITINTILPPYITSGDGGNVEFFDFSDASGDLTSHNLNEFRDDVQQNENLDNNFLFIKNIWGKRLILAGEDSLSISFTKGNLRVRKSNVPDSVLETSVQLNENLTSETSDCVLKGHYYKFNYTHHALLRFYPKKKLYPSSYYYTFYADEKGISSSNLNLRINFIKVSQWSVFSEYSYSWFGVGKGSLNNMMLGIGWRPFGFMQINYGASYLFGPSRNIGRQEGDRIITGEAGSRLIVEFMGPKSYGEACLGVVMQQLKINTKEGRQNDYVWGVGFRSTIPFQMLGSRISPITGLYYFPNLNKRSYMWGAGMFETSLGLRINFFSGK